MSIFDGDLQLGPEVEQFREMLERLADEVKDDTALLETISDNVFNEIGRQALEDGRKIPLDPDTVHNKALAGGRVKRRRKRKRTGRRGKIRGVNSQPGPLAQSPEADGLVSALTVPYELGRGNRAAERQVGAGRILWGTKGMVKYAHPHITGSSRGLPARLRLLEPDAFAEAAVDPIKDEMAQWFGAKLEEAGAPSEFIQAVTEGRF